MSNLSQFFALNGNKIKKIQTVTAVQTSISFAWTWSGVTASISAVDTSKTLLICTPANTTWATYDAGFGVSVSKFGHGAIFNSSTQLGFYGPSESSASGGFGAAIRNSGAQMVVQVVEFE